MYIGELPNRCFFGKCIETGSFDIEYLGYTFTKVSYTLTSEHSAGASWPFAGATSLASHPLAPSPTTAYVLASPFPEFGLFCFYVNNHFVTEPVRMELS